jgi:hypothetical protein
MDAGRGAHAGKGGILSAAAIPGECAVEFEYGIVYGPDGEAWRYGNKHAARFGRYLSQRPATAEDPLDEYRITYEFKDSAPTRARYLKRKHDKRHPNQPVLFADMFAPKK